MSSLILYAYCDGCGRKIMVGETAHETSHKPSDPYLRDNVYCEDCCKRVNTLWWWERRAEAEDDGSA